MYRENEEGGRGPTGWLESRVSRRGFLGRAAQLGAALGAAMVGGSLIPAGRASASSSDPNSPDYIQCPPPCTGVCSATSSSCITGGERCTARCPGNCIPPMVEAYGYWLNTTLGTCAFYCAAEPC